MSMKPHWALAVLAGLGAGLGTGLVQADQVRVYGANEVPRAEDVANILRGGASGQAAPMKTRGIRLDPGYQQSSAEARAETDLAEISEPKEGSFALPIQFSFNSAAILPGAAPQLQAVAEGIKLVPEARVVVEGHTDAKGSDQYNQRLSLARAEAVKRYLVERHGIRSDRLVTKGLGEQAPLKTEDPYAPENRRVQFRAAP